MFKKIFKMKCPACKSVMIDEIDIFQHKPYECINCKTLLKVSNLYKIGYIIFVFLTFLISISIADKLIYENTVFQKVFIRPLIAEESIY
ncbi:MULTISPECIES: hypothetical protein [unclassified Clostridium]|uniref:hypothetical protein n=1 Tax=unclassified Clostridium TaxID=2614128 RepID=UPI00189BF38B|nr:MULTISPECIES: hypothetical protein [unclassified Clostridium]